jgi:hypothetical protein
MKSIFVNIRMTPELKAVLQAMADAECHSLSAQITVMLEAMLKK